MKSWQQEPQQPEWRRKKSQNAVILVALVTKVLTKRKENLSENWKASRVYGTRDVPLIRIAK